MNIINKRISMRKNCQHKKLNPIHKVRKNYPYGRKSDARITVGEIKYYECDNCGQQFFDKNKKQMRVIVKKEVK
jgi:YgiT-type zinc finger domain-containing protein